MKYKFTKGERVMVSNLIAALPGVNRTDGRLVTKVTEHLALEEVQMTIPFADLGGVSEHELTELEVLWILDHINKSFEKSEMSPQLCAFALSMEDKLKDEPQEEKPEKTK